MNALPAASAPTGRIPNAPAAELKSQVSQGMRKVEFSEPNLRKNRSDLRILPSGVSHARAVYFTTENSSDGVRFQN